MSVEGSGESTENSIDIEDLTPHADNLVCESCYSDTVLGSLNDPELNNEPGNTASVECQNPECGYDGWIRVKDGEIIHFGGDIFMGDDHEGHREEPNVTYQEHYKVDTDEDAPSLGDNNPEHALTFTTDEILGGSKPVYICSCGYTFYSKKDLAKHLLAVKHNREGGATESHPQNSPNKGWGERREKLEGVVVESVEKMNRGGLKPADWEVYVDEGELWMNIWFDDDPKHTLEEQKSDGMEIFKQVLNKSDTGLPTTINVSYQEDTLTDGISCWWDSEEQ